MSETLKVSDHLAQDQALPTNRGKLKGHRIVVAGIYLSSDIDPHNGHFSKKEISYREEFVLGPQEHTVHGQGALGHILSDKKLADRLSKNDASFRAIKTHRVIEHENLFELTAEEAKAAAAEPAPIEA